MSPEGQSLSHTLTIQTDDGNAYHFLYDGDPRSADAAIRKARELAADSDLNFTDAHADLIEERIREGLDHAHANLKSVVHAPNGDLILPEDSYDEDYRII
jgi:hypothetical protein